MSEPQHKCLRVEDNGGEITRFLRALIADRNSEIAASDTVIAGWDYRWSVTRHLRLCSVIVLPPASTHLEIKVIVVDEGVSNNSDFWFYSQRRHLLVYGNFFLTLGEYN